MLSPHYLHPQHLDELVNGSGIDLHIASLNFSSLQDGNAYDYLLISEQLPRTNTGMVRANWLQRYAHVESGGWWCSGLDPLRDWDGMEWGCFKPNQPRQNEKGKTIKYEHPPSTPTRIFCLRTTQEIWRRVGQRYNVNLPENLNHEDRNEAGGFWRWVMASNIPIIICEGAKKAASLLSHGYAAIAVPGITSGYRTHRDDLGRVVSRQLIPDLGVFAITKRTVYICFDYETEPRKIAAVSNAIAQLGILFQQKSCPVQVIQLPGQEKGVDEFIVNQGMAGFEKIYQQSVDLEVYLAQIKPHNQLTLVSNVTVNRRYLGDVPFPMSGLVGVKSAKGTGKTTSLQGLIQQAKNQRRPVLLITHRIQLGKFLCEKIGINWGISDANLWEPLAFGLCVDSIWKLNPDDWHGAVVILDEVEQSLWHLLNSATCKDRRVKILKVFQQLIATILTSGGLVIAQDADLSDVSLEYLQQLSGMGINPWTLVNQWQPEKGWDVTFYDAPNPTPLIQQLEFDLIAGRKCYVTTDSRTGRYSSETIASYINERLAKFQKLYPNTLVVSSFTTNTPGHAASELIENINAQVSNYDAVFVTPSLGTGVSIDVVHFDRVYGIFQGVIPDSEARQALARVRSDVPRIVWCAKRGIGTIGSGSTNYRLLSDWYQENQKENLALLSPLHRVDVDLPLVYDPIHLRTWAKMSARVNASITLYRQSMKDGLISDGHQISIRSNAAHKNIICDLRHAFLATDPQDTATRQRLILEIVKVQKDWWQSRQKSKEISSSIKHIKRQNQLKEATAIAYAEDIDYHQYEILTSKHSLTTSERQQTAKYILRQRYGVAVTPDLKIRDDKGYYPQLLTHYYLTHESEYFHLRDKQELDLQLWVGEGQIFLPDLKNYTLKIEALRALGMLDFLAPNRQFHENDADLILLKNSVIQCNQHIKRALGINLVQGNEQISTLKTLGRLLGLLGLKLQRTSDRTPTESAEDGVTSGESRTYQISPATLNDGRTEIFKIWQYRDDNMLEKSKTIAIFNRENLNIKIDNSERNNSTFANANVMGNMEQEYGQHSVVPPF